MDVLCKPVMIKTFVVVRADYWNYICKAGLLRGPLYVATVETRELLTTFFSTSHFPFFFKLSPLCICSNDQPTCEIDRDGVRRDRERRPLSTSKRSHLVL